MDVKLTPSRSLCKSEDDVHAYSSSEDVMSEATTTIAQWMMFIVQGDELVAQWVTPLGLQGESTVKMFRRSEETKEICVN